MKKSILTSIISISPLLALAQSTILLKNNTQTNIKDIQVALTDGACTYKKSWQKIGDLNNFSSINIQSNNQLPPKYVLVKFKSNLNKTYLAYLKYTANQDFLNINKKHSNYQLVMNSGKSIDNFTELNGDGTYTCTIDKDNIYVSPMFPNTIRLPFQTDKYDADYIAVSNSGNFKKPGWWDFYSPFLEFYDQPDKVIPQYIDNNATSFSFYNSKNMQTIGNILNGSNNKIAHYYGAVIVPTYDQPQGNGNFKIKEIPFENPQVTIKNSGWYVLKVSGTSENGSNISFKLNKDNQEEKTFLENTKITLNAIAGHSESFMIQRNYNYNITCSGTTLINFNCKITKRRI